MTATRRKQSRVKTSKKRFDYDCEWSSFIEIPVGDVSVFVWHFPSHLSSTGEFRWVWWRRENLSNHQLLKFKDSCSISWKNNVKQFNVRWLPTKKLNLVDFKLTPTPFECLILAHFRQQWTLPEWDKSANLSISSSYRLHTDRRASFESQLFAWSHLRDERQKLKFNFWKVCRIFTLPYNFFCWAKIYFSIKVDRNFCIFSPFFIIARTRLFVLNVNREGNSSKVSKLERVRRFCHVFKAHAWDKGRVSWKLMWNSGKMEDPVNE